MKKYLVIPVALLALASCNKEEAVMPAANEIILSVGGEAFSASVETKATAIGSLPTSINVMRTTGSAGSETVKNASASMSISAGAIATGWVQTATPTTYNYHLSNVAMSVTSGNPTIAASNATDVIAGSASSSALTPAVALDHIFARTGTLLAKAPAGYTISGVTWEIASNAGAGVSGTYNMNTKAWSGTSALAKQAFTSSSDLYLVPGSYKIYLTYTLTKGDWTKSTTKSADVTLVGGKVNNLKIGSDGTVPLIDGGASDISVTVTLNPWGSTDISVPLS